MPEEDIPILPPLRVSANGRYLESPAGSPFFWLGDTAWELFHRLDREQGRRYLRNRAAKGFSVIQAVCLAELDGVETPNAEGELPFEDQDPARPRDAYFALVDQAIDESARLGMYVGLLPTWGRYWAAGGPYDRPIFTPELARTYGRYLGLRYGQRPVIWILGGDRHIASEQERAVLLGMAAGLREGDGGRNVLTFHPRGPGRSSEAWPDAALLDFNLCQTSHAARQHDPGLSVSAEYTLEPPRPVIDGEPRYEGIPVGFYNAGSTPHDRFDDRDVRTAAYAALLAGACGHTYGHNSVWQMWEPGRTPIIHANTPWIEALDHPGAFQMGWLARLWRSRPWHCLQPAPDLVLNAPREGPGAIRAAFSADPALAFVYTPDGLAFSLNLRRFRAPRLRASWFDPRYGVLYPFHTMPNFAHQTFAPPGVGRPQDWLVVLEDAEGGAPLELFSTHCRRQNDRPVERPPDG